MEYEKDFKSWNKVKERLDENSQGISFYEKEIWWCSLGVNVGHEQDGKGSMFIRPVYILKKINSNMFIGIPLTSNLKNDYAHIAFYFNYDFSTATISQIRILDKNRLFNRIGNTSDYLHNKMKKATVAFILS